MGCPHEVISYRSIHVREWLRYAQHLAKSAVEATAVSFAGGLERVDGSSLRALTFSRSEVRCDRVSPTLRRLLMSCPLKLVGVSCLTRTAWLCRFGFGALPGIWLPHVRLDVVRDRCLPPTLVTALWLWSSGRRVQLLLQKPWLDFKSSHLSVHRATLSIRV